MTVDGNPRLSIVVLTYNRLVETRITISKLIEMVTHRRDIEVIAVDNGSTDGTAQLLKRYMDRVRVFLLDDNRGIGGLNHGFQHARGEYIMVLDDDAHPRNIATIDRLINCLENWPSVGVVACRIEYPDGRRFRTWHLPEIDIPGPSIAFVGCGFGIRRNLFAKIGWFPEHFFLYQNEVDTAIRVMLNGYGIHYEPSCRVIHRESATGRTSWRQVYFPTRNTIWIIRRYFPMPEALLMITSRLLFGGLRAIQHHQMRPYFLAVKAGFRIKIRRELLPRELCGRLRTFRHHNNIFYHLMGTFKFS
jgi:GT2 family glycosyltransferase